MTSFIFFIRNLFNSSDFPARWHCGNWDELVGWMHISSDILIWLSYMAIPAMLFYFIIKKKGGLPFNYIFVLFCSFIFFCGTVHLIEAIIFWNPIYRFSGLLKFITAVVSVLTAFSLFKIIPEAMELKSPADLKKEVDDRTQQLTLMAAELKKSNNELEQFANIASHDLQEPLRMVSQNMGRLKKHLKTDDDEKIQKYINFAEQGSSRMQQMINDLLEFSMINKEKDEFEEVDLNKTVKLALENLSVSISEKKAQVKIKNLPTIFGNEIQLVRLFQNLVANSLKYSDSERIPLIRISSSSHSKSHFIKINDNGIGFKQEDAEKIFELFKRLHTQETPGTGIGLSASKKIVEIHHGEIWAESEPGKGSTFIIKFPAVIQQA